MTVEEEMKILEEINKEIIKKGRLLYNYEIKEVLDRFIVKHDNAPTVDIPCNQIIWEQGYECGKNERPQGEWKLVERDNQDIDVVCPFCNSIRFPAYSHGYTIEEVEEYLIRHHLPKFCEDCGADMRKGGAEE